MNHNTLLLILFISGIFLSCTSNDHKPISIEQEFSLKGGNLNSVFDEVHDSIPVFISGTYVAFEQSHFQSTYDTIAITKRRNTATIYDIRRNGSFVRLLDAKHHKPVNFSDTWIGSYDDAGNVLFMISQGERFVFDPVKDKFTWRDMPYIRIE
jgi:hypothetical protein